MRKPATVDVDGDAARVMTRENDREPGLEERLEMTADGILEKARIEKAQRGGSPASAARPSRELSSGPEAAPTSTARGSATLATNRAPHDCWHGGSQ